MVNALIAEIQLQKSFFNEAVETLYFGGGTPSLLTKDELQKIIQACKENFDCSALEEVTLEANPDDLNSSYLQHLKEVGVNRLSIGIQSFFDEDLHYMNRAHKAQQAKDAVRAAQIAGINNISIDLIYGFPLLSNEKWLSNIQEALALNIAHISCYSMTVEKDTALSKFISKGVFLTMNDEQSLQHFTLLQETLKKANFIHYEISNFCKPNCESKHNSSYWLQKKYVGIGPSAHSYNGENRYWNVSNNMKYIAAIENKKIPFEKETISEKTAYNEYILTRLRTHWGIEKASINRFSKDISSTFYTSIKQHIHSKNIECKAEKYFLTEQGKLIADRIASDLFVL